MPASVLLKLNDTLYKIPESYFENFRGSPFFSDSSRYQYPLNFSYTIANEDEKIYNACTTDILFLPFTQAIIKSATK